MKKYNLKPFQGTIGGMIYILNSRLHREQKFKISVKYNSNSYLGKMLLFNLGYWVLALYSHEMLTPKQWYKSKKYRIRKWLRKSRENLTHQYKMLFDNKPVYYELWSRDCDMCESTTYGMSKNYKDHYQYLNDESEWEWLEGAVSVNVISADEYAFYKDEPVVIRDRIMEAFENSRGTSVNL